MVLNNVDVLSDVKVILMTDVGSTTSKARLVIKKDGEYRFAFTGEAPTTVEAPFEDVTMGVRNAIIEVEEKWGHKIIDYNGIIRRKSESQDGVDLYVSTSSAGGGLQMMVSGVIGILTGQSARRAALGAGAIVTDVISSDDEIPSHQKIRRIRDMRPDMILMAGGTDGGDTKYVSEIAELIVAAAPKHRLGEFLLPIVYAGNKDIQGHIKDLMAEGFALKIVDNIRPVLEVENITQAREAVHELFMEHVMKHAPGYTKLMKLVDAPIMPTPWGEGRMIQEIANQQNCNAIGVGLGGATTNVYSIFDGVFNRTVSANLGMSYSICNVMKETGIDNILRWIPFNITIIDLRNTLRNKMIRPTTIPQTMHALIIEHAVAREALRLGLEHHKKLAIRLRGTISKLKSLGETIEMHKKSEGLSLEEELTLVDMMKTEYIVGTGGLLSHAPRRVQSKMILIDSFQPEGIANLAQDSVFMMPHLGVLSTVHSKAAMEVFEKDCLIWMGCCVAPKGIGKEGDNVATVNIEMPDGSTLNEKMLFGSIKKIPLAIGEVANIEVKPSQKFDFGAGKGNSLVAEVKGGVVGITLDGRGRPITFHDDIDERRRQITSWYSQMGVYPSEIYDSVDEEEK